MAERRMFAKTIIDSDAFLDMPLSAQSLYFHLSMRADDDGFINNPKKIQRMIGASDDDCKLLLAKRFVIAFESGVVVIKHWKIHNYIQRDRYKPTIYQEEKQQLEEKSNKAYTEITQLSVQNEQQCIHDVSGMDTQVRLGEDSVGKYSIGEGRIEENAPPPSAKEIINLFNSLCPSFPAVKQISQKRIEKINAILRKYTPEQIEQCFEIAENSAFLKGDNKRDWVATFDWLVNEENMAKVLEGNYTDTPKQTGSFQTDEFIELALARTRAESQKTPPRTAGEDDEIRERAERLRERLG